MLAMVDRPTIASIRDHLEQITRLLDDVIAENDSLRGQVDRMSEVAETYATVDSAQILDARDNV